METLSYQTPNATNQRLARRRTGACAIVLGVLIVANALLIRSAAADRSWGALHIMLLDSPITNGVILLFSSAMTPFVRRWLHGTAVWPFVLAAIVGPVAALIVDAALIMSMPLHGC